MKRKISIILLILIIIFLNSYKICANEIVNNETNNEQSSNPLGIIADAAILMDVNTGKTLYDKNSEQKSYPASTTKLLTAIITLEKYKDLSKKVNISYYSVHSVPYTYSVAALLPGEQQTLADLLNALMVASANDAAYSLAEYIANDGNNYPIDSSEQSKQNFENSIKKFSEMMNTKAKEIGCTNTNFVNPNGIQNENHYSTAHDLALIGKYAYSNIGIQTLAQKKEVSMPNNNVYTNKIRNFKTTNLLLNPEKSGYYQYANGLKTGYTDAAQYCIIASAKKDDRSLIAVILHSPNCTDENTSRESDCKKLFEYGFNEFINTTLINKNDVVRKLFIINGTSSTNTLDLICDESQQALIKKGKPMDITPEIKITKHFAPIAKGEVIGTITYLIDGQEYTSNLLADHDVYSTNYMSIIWIMTSIFATLLFIIAFLSRKNKN